MSVSLQKNHKANKDIKKFGEIKTKQKPSKTDPGFRKMINKTHQHSSGHEFINKAKFSSTD